MNTDIVSFWILTHFLSALINGDTTGLDDAEKWELERFERYVHYAFGTGHWSTTEDRSEFGLCEVTERRGDVQRVEWVFTPLNPDLGGQR